MPIYAYRCDACGHAKDVLQKMSDAPLTDCPECGAPAFKKQLTAAGWYVTDFRGGSGGTSAAGTATKTDAAAPAATPAASAPASDSTSSTASAAPAASGGCGTSCACH